MIKAYFLRTASFLLVSLVFITTPFSLVSAQTSSHYWTLNEGSGTTARDVYGSANGTIQGATYKTGKIGKALYFDGVNDYVDLGTLDMAGQTMTISAWFKSPDLNANCGSYDCRIISKTTSSSNNDHYFMLSTIKPDTGNDTLLRFRLKTGKQSDPTTSLIASSGSLKPNTWYQAVARHCCM